MSYVKPTHGWFSYKQSQYGTVIYATPDGQDEIEVSCLGYSATEPPSNSGWDDYQYVGQVGNYLRPGKQGPPQQERTT